MKFEDTQIWGFEHAIRGMRNPLESWSKGDSIIDSSRDIGMIVGKDDLKLMKALIKGGSEQRKFLRQIFVSVDITAPLYWWKEFDTYKVGTVANSTSTMHRLSTTPITRECFEMDDFVDVKLADVKIADDISPMRVSLSWMLVIAYLENLRKLYVETKEKSYWKELIRMLPESWLQKRTITMNYENLYSMYHHRKNHKLNEWSGKDDDGKINFCTWVRSLPYASELITGE